MEMKIALDSNAYTDFVRGDPGRVRIVQMASAISFPVIVLGELLAGFQLGTQRPKNESALRSFLRSSRVGIVDADIQTASHYAHVSALLRTQGTPLPTNDVWIAAIALQHGLTLCTSDLHFRHVPHLAIC